MKYVLLRHFWLLCSRISSDLHPDVYENIQAISHILLIELEVLNQLRSTLMHRN